MKYLLCAALLCISAPLNAADISQEKLIELSKVVRTREPGMSQGSVSEKTIKAAYELFSTYSFLFKTSEEIISLLGKPTETSQSDSEHALTLVYRFDSGLGGLEYRISLQAQKAFRVETVSIN